MTADAEARFPLFGSWEAPGESSAAVAFAIDPLGRILMQLRDDRPGVIHPGAWSPFGGHVEPGETLRAAVVREFAEETGLVLPPEGFAPLGRALSTSPARTRLYAYRVRIEARPEAVRLGEGAGFAFLTPGQLAAAQVAAPLRAMSLRVAEAVAAGRDPAG